MRAVTEHRILNRRLGAYLFALVAALSSVSALGALETLKLIVLPFDSPSVVDDEKRKITEQLRVALINSREFILIDPFLVEEAMVEHGVTQPSSAEKEMKNKLVDIGKEVDADVVISGSIGTGNDKYKLTIRMISTVKGKLVFEERFSIRKNRYVKDTREIAQKLVEKGRVISQVTLGDIRSLVEVGQYMDAEETLDTYLDFHEKSSATDDLRTIINEGIAENAYKKAEELVSVYLFDDAMLQINKALSYTPENVKYQNFLEEIEERRREFKKKKEEELLTTLEELVDKRRFDTADSLVEVMYNRGFDSTRLNELHDKVRKGLEEKEHFRKAQKALWERDYVKARMQVREAIQINPEKQKYHSFLEQLNEEEREYEDSKKVWEEYRTELKNIDLVRLFAVSKPLLDGYTGARLWNTFSYRDKDTTDTVERELNGVEGYYTWHRLLPYDLNLSSFKTYYAIRAGSRLSYGHREEKGEADEDTGFRTVEQDRIFYGELFGSAGIEVSFLSILLSMFGEINSGGMYWGYYERRPAVDKESVTHSGYYALGGGLLFSIGWVPSKETLIKFGYRRSWNFFFPREDRERFGFSSVSVGVEWKGR